MSDERNPRLGRRRSLSLIAGILLSPKVLGQTSSGPITRHSSLITPYAKVVPGYRIRFPHDEGSHPDFRVEWWYVTGWLNAGTAPLGFQVTFFRARPELKDDNPSAFTPRQIVIAHAALADPARGSLLHDQRAARSGFELAGASVGRTHAWIDDWVLQQSDAIYRARIPAREFTLDLAFKASQPPLLQGEQGLSRKGPAPESASYYYSLPHLAVSGSVTHDGKTREAAGSAWLDHEWSSQYMEKESVGWDWVGINLDSGAALMAFRMRDAQGKALWAGGTMRDAGGRRRVLEPGEVRFTPRREWRSPRTGARYPVSFTVVAGNLEITLEPLFDDQENDARASSGTIYWEGAVRAERAGRPVGLGYLELTGYWQRMRL